jgi:GH25 family lysozyme M1 (1,4-beta-N-acetylmuramidase)
MQSRNSANLPGIDISHYEAVINYAEILAQGKKAVYIKATEGSTGDTAKDPTFAKHNTSCRALGLPTGAYHLIHCYPASTIDAQVANFLNEIKGQPLSMPLMIDAEPEIIAGMTPETVTAQVLDFAAKLKAATGVEVILYACTDSIINAFTADITALRLYIADTRYGDTAPGENGKTESWCGFQYSWKGDIGGVTVDLDEFTPDMIMPEYTYGAPAPVPAPAPAPKPAPIPTPIPFDQTVLDAQRELNALGVRDDSGDKLSEDGKAGKHTLEALGNHVLVYDPSHIKACVKLLQKRLGFTGADIDGRFGDKTLAAVRAYQTAHGLQVDGKSGPQTWAAIIG